MSSDDMIKHQDSKSNPQNSANYLFPSQKSDPNVLELVYNHLNDELILSLWDSSHTGRPTMGQWATTSSHIYSIRGQPTLLFTLN